MESIVVYSGVQPSEARAGRWVSYSLGDFIGGDRTIWSRFASLVSLRFGPRGAVRGEVIPVAQTPFWRRHTTMLLGAARYLAETRAFNGTVNFIFQPGEEGMGGALAMLQDGLFQRFPCDAIYGMHNRPGAPVGHFSITPGAAMAGGAFFDIVVTGRGAHGARPEASIDPVMAACYIGTALQSVVSRNVPPSDMAVLSVTKIEAGDAYNVIPHSAMVLAARE